MKIVKYEFPGVQSICWHEDGLIDWVSGGMSIKLDGSIEAPTVSYAYRFDSAIQTRCGRFAIVYEKCGTKGLVLDQGQVVREINRSYYFAHVYEFPVAVFIGNDGRPRIAYCPNEYNILVIEDLLTGECLFSQAGLAPSDYFHSRLCVSEGSTRLISAGWVWHPFECVEVFNITDQVNDVSRLDSQIELPEIDGEVSSADFLDDYRIVICTSEESLNDDAQKSNVVGCNCLAVINLGTRSIETAVDLETDIGSLYALDSDYCLSFFQHPKLISIRTGKVIINWDGIYSGKQAGSILSSVELPPSIAVDKAKQRFAVAGKDTVTIVSNISALL